MQIKLQRYSAAIKEAGYDELEFLIDASGEHDRLQASFLTGLRCSHRWRRVPGNLKPFGKYVMESVDVSRHDIAGIWVAFFQECQQYRCGQGGWWGITQPFERADVSAREYFESVLPSVATATSPRPLLCTLRAGKPPRYRCHLGCILAIWVAFF